MRIFETPVGFEPTYHDFADRDLNHSDTVSYFSSPGRLRSDSLHYVTVALPRLSYRTIFADEVGLEPTVDFNVVWLTARSFRRSGHPSIFLLPDQDLNLGQLD